MAKYNCDTFGQYANLLKKDIKAAMRGKIRIPADVEERECGFVEVDASKEECEKIILNSVDEIVIHSFADVKHGHWEESKCLDDCFWVCSCCKFPSQAVAAPKLYKYCPNCGARMDVHDND